MALKYFKVWQRAQVSLVAFVLSSASATVSAAEFHISPMGSAGGDGSAARPWDIATGLNRGTHPGDTFWLHGGTYGNGGPAAFTCTLYGTEAQPVIVREFPGEHAIINGGIAANGTFTTFWGFEITNTGVQRDVVSETGMPNARVGGLNLYGRGMKAINLVVHNTGHPAIGFWNAVGDGGEVYGCLLWGNGIYDPSPGFSGSPRGNGTYAQNQVGNRYISDNISFRNWTEGLDAHSAGRSWVNGFTFEGNFSFDNPSGELTTNTMDPANPMERLRVIDNCTYRRQNDTTKTTAQFGYYNDVFNRDITVEGNYFVMGSDDDRALHLKLWGRIAFNRNTVISERYASWWWGGVMGESIDWDNNTYLIGGGNGRPFIVGPSRDLTNGETFLDFAAWKTRTGFDAASTFAVGRPTGLRVFKRRNRYESNRAHIAIYNWDRRASVDLNLTDLVAPDAQYTLRDAQNYFGAPVLSGTYRGGTVAVPMNLTEVAVIRGPYRHWMNRHTAPEFGTFVLTSDRPLVAGGSSDAGVLSDAGRVESDGSFDGGLETRRDEGSNNSDGTSSGEPITRSAGCACDATRRGGGRGRGAQGALGIAVVVLCFSRVRRIVRRSQQAEI